MSEMIERVAEAIAVSGNGGTWDDWYNEDQKEFHRKRARAAIEAMREPTPETHRAMRSAFERQKPVWESAIDAALGKVDA